MISFAILIRQFFSSEKFLMGKINSLSSDVKGLRLDNIELKKSLRDASDENKLLKNQISSLRQCQKDDEEKYQKDKAYFLEYQSKSEARIKKLESENETLRAAVGALICYIKNPSKKINEAELEKYSQLIAAA
jgi:chromosome segregation ATPase